MLRNISQLHTLNCSRSLYFLINPPCIVSKKHQTMMIYLGGFREIVFAMNSNARKIVIFVAMDSNPIVTIKLNGKEAFIDHY